MFFVDLAVLCTCRALCHVYSFQPLDSQRFTTYRHNKLDLHVGPDLEQFRIHSEFYGQGKLVGLCYVRGEVEKQRKRKDQRRIRGEKSLMGEEEEIGAHLYDNKRNMKSAVGAISFHAALGISVRFRCIRHSHSPSESALSNWPRS